MAIDHKENKHANLKGYDRKILVMQKVAEETGLSKEDLADIFTDENLELAADVLASLAKYLNNLFETTNFASTHRDAAIKQKMFLMNLLTMLLGQAAAIKIDYKHLFTKKVRKHAIGADRDAKQVARRPGRKVEDGYWS